MGPMGAVVGMSLSLVIGLTGCTTSGPALPALCIGDLAPLQQALLRAPAPVRLADGTSISTCTARVADDAQLQSLGATLTPLADSLAARAPRDERSAVSLGYLIGAVRRGAAHSDGVDAELVRRLEQDAVLDGAPAAAHAAVDRGIEAGTRLG